MLGASKDCRAGTLQGRTERNEIVHLAPPPGRKVVGEIVEVTIERANKHSLFGALTERSAASLPAADVAAPPARRRGLPVLTSA